MLLFEIIFFELIFNMLILYIEDMCFCISKVLFLENVKFQAKYKLTNRKTIIQIFNVHDSHLASKIIKQTINN